MPGEDRGTELIECLLPWTFDVLRRTSEAEGMSELAERRYRKGKVFKYLKYLVTWYR